MIKKRLIPVLLLKNGFLVQSKNFQYHHNIGHPLKAVKRLSQWCSDELIYLDISRDDIYDTHREDHGYKNFEDFLSIIKEVSKLTFMPITVGGKIRSLQDVENRFKFGADKVCLNSAPLENPEIINQIAREFGSQSIVISIDVKFVNKKYEIFYEYGKKKAEYNLDEWLNIVQDKGAGEILLNSIDKDGSKTGYDLNLLNYVSKNCKIPIIACGGAGKNEDFLEAISDTDIDAVAAANFFHHSDLSVYNVKKYLYEKKCNVRKPDILNV